MKANNYDQKQKQNNHAGAQKTENTNACTYSQGTPQQAVKNKKNEKDAVSREDWEGGGSRPAQEEKINAKSGVAEQEPDEIKEDIDEETDFEKNNNDGEKDESDKENESGKWRRTA